MGLTIYIYCTDSKPTAGSPRAFIIYLFFHLTILQQTSLAPVKHFPRCLLKITCCFLFDTFATISPRPGHTPHRRNTGWQFMFCPGLSDYRHFFEMGITLLIYSLALNTRHSLFHLICIANTTISNLVIELKS